jgi:sec-independent protein translocase protein TatA
MMDLFDSWPKILIIAILVVVLFGYRKLPDAARSLGKSMRILKTEVQGLHQDEPATAAAAEAAPAQLQAPAAPVAAAPVVVPEAQAQIDALSRQLADLQQTVAMNNVSDSAQAK